MLGEKKNWRSPVHRKRLSKARRHSICVFTEGETESLYFSDFEVPTLRVKCFGLGGGNARHLVREVISYKRTAQFSDYDQYWVVFDCDDNSEEELRNAIALAEANKIKWCFSNPCFEIWFLLHFVYRDSATTAYELKQTLIPRYIQNYVETMHGVKPILESRQQMALRNAEKLNPQELRKKWRQQLRQANPSTNVDELVLCLNTLAGE